MQQARIFSRERGAIAEAVQREEDTLRAPAEHQRDDKPGLGPNTEAAEPAFMKTRAIELVLEALHLAGAHGMRSEAALERDLLPRKIRGELSGARDDLEVVVPHQLDQQRPRGYQRPPTLGHQPKHDLRVRLVPEGRRDLRGRLERGDGALKLVPALAGPGVAPSVLDRNAREVRRA